MSTSPPFKAAIVGYGLSAKVFHIPLILALPNDFKLHGIVQRSPKPDDNAEKDHPGTKAYRSVDEVYADKEVDLMVITSIPETHFDMCKNAMEAGKHVVVEKPFVPTRKEADELAQIAHKTGKKLAVYQNRRWDSDFLTLRQTIDQGLLGDIAEFNTHFDRHRPDPPAGGWKTVDVPGHGAIFDLGTHLIDQVYTLFGPPQRVTGFVGIQRQGVKEGVHDSCTVLLHYDSRKMLVTVKAGVVSPEEEQLRYWVKGTRGSFKKFHLDPQEDQLKAMKPGAAIDSKTFGVEDPSHVGTLTESKDGKMQRRQYPTVKPQTYVEYYKRVAEALKGSADMPIKAEEARDVLGIIEAAVKSSEEGRTVKL